MTTEVWIMRGGICKTEKTVRVTCVRIYIVNYEVRQGKAGK